MENEEQKWKQTEVEEEEEEETTLLVRKSRDGDDSKTTGIAAVVDVEVGDGVPESNGHEILSHVAVNGSNGVLEDESQVISEEQKTEEINGVLENESLVISGEQKTEEINGVLENESEAINGEQKPENLVFYDKVEGIWKCRICSWTYQNGSVCVDHIQNHRGQMHKLMNLKTLNIEYEGVDSKTAYVGEKQIVKGAGPTEFDVSSLDFAVQNNSAYVINNRYGGDPSQISFQERTESSKEIESAEVDVINEDDLEVTEYDVEGVLQKQNTHDLYCPNCKSCITRRVILRKRKRRIRISDEEVKRNKVEAAVGSKLGSGSGQSPRDQVHHADEVGDNDAQLPEVDEDERDKGPDIFRCLSCFSFFIPTGNGFKSFRIFGEKGRKENVQNEQAPSIKKNWFTSMFGSNKQETTIEQGSSTVADVQRGDTGVNPSTIGDQSSNNSVLQRAPSHAEASEGLAVTAGANGTLGGGAKIPTFLKQKPLMNGKVIVDTRDELNTTAAKTEDTDIIQLSPASGSILKESDEDGKFTIPASTPHQEHDVKVTIQTESLVQNEKGNFGSRDNGHGHPTEVSQHMVTKTEFEIHPGESLIFDNISALLDAPGAQGQDTVITIDVQSEGSYQTAIRPSETTNILQSATQISTARNERTEERKEFEIEVVKSIVYGGLAESITSLSVVSSAAGGGAATLNVLALGMANLIGGLFIICHNIWELRADRVEQVNNQVSDEATDQGDRYRQLLGRRRNFVLHVIVAITSYIIFGLVPPVVYGFSFCKSDDKQLKLAVVAAASLVCILILAVGRAYVRRPPKHYSQSVAAFVILGFMVSGVSYAAGVLIERLLEKIGIFEPGSVSNLLTPEMRPTGSGWSTY